MKSWSSTQSSIALSSGEAEFNGVVRGAGVGLGYQSLLRDLGIDIPIRVWTDSSAAVGICSRQGLGKLRHLDTHTLWVQQAVRSKKIDLRKVDGEVNPADLFTKHSLTRERMMSLTRLFDCEFRGGRPESAPQVRITDGTKATLAELWAVDDSEEKIPTVPIMPHRIFSQEILDRLYPPLAVANAEDDEEDIKDPILERGMEIADELTDRANLFGRRRVDRETRTEKTQAEEKSGSSPISK